MDEQRRLEGVGAALVAQTPELEGLWERVVEVTWEAHADQYRNNGRPYLAHVLDIADILLEWEVEPLIVMGGLIHDSVRYGRFRSQRAVATRLDHEDLSSLLHLATRLATRDSIVHYARDNSRLQKIFDLMVEDVRGVLIRCANRLADLRDLDTFKGEQRDGLLLNTEEVYLPLLERLGMWRVRTEVENRLFQARTPDRYAAILRWQERERTQRATAIAAWQDSLMQALAVHGLTRVEVRIEYRHPASTFRRLLADLPRDVDDLSQLDTRHLFVTTVLVPRVDDAYIGLAAVHECGTPSMASFRDHFAQPRDNGYAALHTAVILASSPHYVYLRTPALHQLASRGILLRAAYEAWRYDRLPKGWQPTEERTLRHFMASLRHRQRDRLSLLTPLGDVIELPEGATVLDFAYAIHTNVGRQTGTAFVNKMQVPLNTPLHSGDVVEIRKDLGRKWPDAQWLNWIHTSKAREAIQAQLRQRPDAKGRTLLDKELRRRGRKVDDYESRLAMLASEMGSTPDEVLISMAQGDLRPREVVDRLLFLTTPQRTRLYRVQLTRESAARFPLWHGEMILSVECCAPQAGDPIVGYYTERGIELHLDTCPNVLDPARRVALRWESERVEAQLVKFTLRAVSRRGLINDLTHVIRQANAEIIHLEGKRQGKMDEVNLTLEVTNELELGYLLETIRRLPSVNRVLVDGREAEAAIDDLRSYLAPPQPIISPFSPGRPVAGSGHFWGRGAEVLTIETLLSGESATSLLVQGPRRIGKTSLLKHLQESRAVKERYRYIYVDLQAVAYSGVPSVLRHLARHIARAMDSEQRVAVPSFADLTTDPLDTFLTYLAALIDTRRYTQKRILLALDEFGTLVESVRSNALDTRIFHMLRSIIQHNPMLTILLCTSDDVAEMLANDGVLELLNVTPGVRLRHLDAEASQQLIQEPLRGQVYFEPEAVSALLRVTDHHPYYLQILGANLITRLNNEQRRNVYESDILDLARRHMELNGSEFMHLWERTNGAHQALLQALCVPPCASSLSPFGAEAIQRRLRAAGLDLRPEQIREELDRLAQMDTLARVLQADGSARYHVRVELFRDWFAARYPLNVRG